MTNISFRIYHTFGSDNEEKGEKKLKIQLNEYYAIAYDSKHDQQSLYIGRVLGFHEKNLGLDEISSFQNLTSFRSSDGCHKPRTRWFQGIYFRINPQNSDYSEGGRGPGKTFNEENKF